VRSGLRFFFFFSSYPLEDQAPPPLARNSSPPLFRFAGIVVPGRHFEVLVLLVGLQFTYILTNVSFRFFFSPLTSNQCLLLIGTAFNTDALFLFFDRATSPLLFWGARILDFFFFWTICELPEPAFFFLGQQFSSL